MLEFVDLWIIKKQVISLTVLGEINVAKTKGLDYHGCYRVGGFKANQKMESCHSCRSQIHPLGLKRCRRKFWYGDQWRTKRSWWI